MAAMVTGKVVPINEVPLDDLRHSIDLKRPIVLVVDDEVMVADTRADVLSRAGFSTLTAYDGESALELARSNRPALLVSDVSMPGMNGVDLAEAILKAVPHCKVLLCTAYASTVEALTSRMGEYNFAVMAKPIHPIEMLKQVRVCLDTVSAQAIA
jgi:DNA-binding NtrC family response regulator